jgi:flagellar FliL protein
MAIEEELEEEQIELEEDEVTPQVRRKGPGLRVFMIGLPLFIVQLIVVYYITANVILRDKLAELDAKMPKDTTKVEDEPKIKDNVPKGDYFYTIKDVVVNPAESDGNRLLLVSLGFNVTTDEAVNTLRKSEVAIRDAVITELTSRTVQTLSKPSYKDTLKPIILTRVRELVPETPIHDVYFRKYIIQ